MAVVWPSFTKTFHHKPYPAIAPSRQEPNANWKVVLITGAGTGVGEATAYAFAEAAAKVIVLYGRRLHLLSNVKSKLESQYPSTKVAIYSVNIADQKSVTKVFQDVRDSFGPLDIVINSAGHLSDKGPIAASSL